MSNNKEWEKYVKPYQPIFYLDPAGPALEKPLLDLLTRKAAGIHASMVPYKNPAGVEQSFRGFHGCSCKPDIWSASRDFVIPNSNYATNYLLVHYVAYHRSSCSEEELAIVDTWEGPVQDPTDAQRLGIRYIPQGSHGSFRKG